MSYEQRPISVTKSPTSTATLQEMYGTADGAKIVIMHTATDDGAGHFLGDLGTIDYVGKSVSLRVVRLDRTVGGYRSDYEKAPQFEAAIADGGASSGSAMRGGEFDRWGIADAVFAGSSIVARYRVAPTLPTAKTMSFAAPSVVIDLAPYTVDAILPGSVMFAWMNKTYQDHEGVIYRDRSGASPGIESGRMDYASGKALMTDWVVGGTGPDDFQLLSLWTQKGQWATASLFFNTDAAPLRPGAGGFVLTVVDTQGETLTAQVDGQGMVSGAHMRGRVEFARGGVELQFGDYVSDADLTAQDKAQWWYDPADVGAVQPDKIWRPWPVDPTTLRYSAISYIYLPVDVSLMGVDPAALPADGRVAFARPGDTCVVGMTHGGPAFAPSVGMTYDVGHERLSFLQVLNDATGAEILTGYTTDLDAGTATFTDLTGYPALVKVVARTEQYRQIAEVRIDGQVKLTQPIGHEFPVGAVLSTALRQGDRFARVRNVFDQASWDGTTWADAVDATAGPAPSTYNTSQYPVQIANRGAITERWALRFRSGGQLFDLIGEHLGQIASGDINVDFSPTNLAAGAPYFTLLAAGWGAGWVAGNVLFLDTVGAEFPIDLLRCTQPSSPVGVDDSFWLVQRGDVGRAPESEF
jgi:hypothetical protein